MACSSKKVPAPILEPLIAIEGDIALSGTGPLDWDVILSDEGGGICALRGRQLDLELRNLAGLRVRVTGRLAGETRELPEFLDDRYELLPINGYDPVVGTLEAREGAVFIVDSAGGGGWRIDGPLAQALAHFAGYKVWVAGERRGGRAGAAESPSISVESYGIVLPPSPVNRAL